MPRFDESRPILVATLLDLDGPSPRQGAGPIDVNSSITPDDGPFERVAAAILAAVAGPRVAELAIAALFQAGLLDPSALAAIAPIELEDVLDQARVRIAPRPLRSLIKFARWAVDVKFDGELAASASTEFLRESWRGINGLGPGTVDAMLLRAFRRPTYPVDRSTYRILVRHGWLDPSAEYDEARSAAESLAPDDPETLDRISAVMGRLGRDFCKPAVARCQQCPLRALLPEAGPVGTD